MARQLSTSRPILAAILISLVQCSGNNCDPDSEDFELDESVTPAQLDDLLQILHPGSDDWARLTCRDVCFDAYGRTADWQASLVEKCELDLPANDEPSSAGRVECTGIGVEYQCK